MLRALLRLIGVRKPNPTQDWEPDSVIRLALDLDGLAFCGVPLGGRIDDLNALGPADRWDALSLTWLDKGLLVFKDEKGAVEGFSVIWQKRVQYERREFRPFTGECLWQGNAIPLNGRTTETEILSLFGEPYHRCDPRADDYSLFYEFEHHELQVSFHNWVEEPWPPESLTILRVPYLADASNRQFLCVDKPWPPGST